MFEKNKKIQDCVDRLYGVLKDAEYGSEYTWEELDAISGFGGDMKGSYYIANKVCSRLMVFDQRFLVTIQNFGKKIINPSEHSVMAKKTIKKSVKVYKRAGSILACTNMDKLTEEQKVEVVENANKYSTLQLFASELLKKKKIGGGGGSDRQTAGLFLDVIKMFTEKEGKQKYS